MIASTRGAVRPQLSVVVPVHNEEAILTQALEDLRKDLERLAISYEVLLCENGSNDATGALAHLLASQWSRLKVLSLPRANYGLALRRGLTEAMGVYIAALNIDFLDFTFLEQALHILEQERTDIVVGSKRLHGSCDQRSAFRRCLTKEFNRLLGALVQTRLSDTHGLKLLRAESVRPCLNACELDGEMFDTELVLRAERAGLHIRELPVSLSEVRPTRYPIWWRIPSTVYGLIRLSRILEAPSVCSTVRASSRRKSMPEERASRTHHEAARSIHCGD